MVETFRNNVERHLAKRGWNRSELARHIGVRPQYVHQVLSGHRAPGLAVIERWASVLGVEPYTLLKK